MRGEHDHWVVTQLLQHGSVRRAYLGLAGRTRAIDPRLARRMGLVQPSVVEVMSVVESSPGEGAGLRAGDWVLALDEEPISTVDALQRLLAKDQIGWKLQIRALRGRERFTLTVVPVEDSAD